MWLWRGEREERKIGGGGIEVGGSWLDGRGGVVVIVRVSCGGDW